MNPSSIDKLLKEHEILQQCRHQERLLREIDTFWHSLLQSHWRPFSSVNHIENNVLTIDVTHNGVLNKLKQLQPTLLVQLGLRYPQIHQIHLRMSLPETPSVIPVKNNEVLSEDNVMEFQRVAENIKPGPLAEAIQRLVRRRQRDKN